MEPQGKTGNLSDVQHVDMADTAKIIVIVDDNPVVKTLFERGTENLPVDLKIFDSADASWDYLKSNRPAILFLNIRMPDKDGLTFLKELRDLPLHKDTPVVMISSKDYAQDRSVARELGALDFLTKPMPIRVITNVVNKYLQ